MSVAFLFAVGGFRSVQFTRRVSRDLFCRIPRCVGVIGTDCLCNFYSPSPEVFLKYFALLIDNESHHAGVTPFGRPCDQAKSGNHPSVDDEIVFAARREFSLAGQDLKIVAVIRRLLVIQHFGRSMVSVHARLGDERSQRTQYFTRLIGWPKKAIGCRSCCAGTWHKRRRRRPCDPDWRIPAARPHRRCRY